MIAPAADPVNWVDPEGLDFRIIGKDNVTTYLTGGNSKFREFLSKSPDKSIASIEMIGHGNPTGIDVSDEDFIYMDEEDGNKVKFSDDTNGKTLAEVIENKLADGGTVLFNGCNTANESPLSRWQGIYTNITKEFSKQLKNIVVTGNMTFGLSNEVSNPFNRKQNFRIGKEFHGISLRTSYLNGEKQ